MNRTALQGLFQFFLGQDRRMRAMPVKLRCRLHAAGGQDHGAVFELDHGTVPGSDCRIKLPGLSPGADNRRLAVNVDLGVFFRFLPDILQKRTDSVAFQGLANPVEIAAQFFRPLDQIHGISMVGDGQGRTHAGDAAADNHRPPDHGRFRERFGLQVFQLGYSHVQNGHQGLRSPRCFPGIRQSCKAKGRTADLHHSDEARVNAGGLSRIPDLVRACGARGNQEAVRLAAFDFLDQGLHFRPRADAIEYQKACHRRVLF